MEWISLAGQHIGRVRQVFVWRPSAGTMHRGKHPGLIMLFSFQVPPFLDDFLQRLNRVTHRTNLGKRTSTCVLVTGRLEDHAKNMDLRHFSRPLQTIALEGPVPYMSSKEEGEIVA